MDPRSPERGQYEFVQALIREVAYNTLSKKDRKKLHLSAARYFESLGNDEIAGALASHYLAALRQLGRGRRGGRTGRPGSHRAQGRGHASVGARLVRAGRPFHRAGADGHD